MERFLGFVLGIAALALYGPFMFLSGTGIQKYSDWLTKTLTETWVQKIFTLGPGVFAGIALLLLAIRSRN